MCKRKGEKGIPYKVNDLEKSQGNMCTLDLGGELKFDGGFQEVK